MTQQFSKQQKTLPKFRRVQKLVQNVQFYDSYLLYIFSHYSTFGGPHIQNKNYLFPNIPQCLKITGKVSFNIASEARYGYILSGQKLIKNAKKWSFFEKLKNATFLVIFKHCAEMGLATILAKALLSCFNVALQRKVTKKQSNEVMKQML